MPRGKSRIRADEGEIEKAFRAAGFEFGGGYDPITGKYDIVVENPRALNTVRRSLPPDLRDDVAIRVGKLPRPEAAPTGVVSGDWIAGGYPLYPIKTDAQCTFGFPVRFKPTGSTTEVKGVLTAGHCGNVAYHYYNGHWITFGSPMVTPPVSGMHDYKVFESTGLTDNSGNEVYYKNSYNLPGISTRSYYRIYAWAASTSQGVGDIVCKSGQQTGLTCGRISAPTAGSKSRIQPTRPTNRTLVPTATAAVLGSSIREPEPVRSLPESTSLVTKLELRRRRSTCPWNE